MTEKPKILIIEDETPAAMMMVHVLSRTGCNALVACTGEKGMALAQENKFDLIVLDVDLPDISGFEICNELKQRRLSRHTPIFFVTKESCDEDRHRAFELGAVDYIIKPFEVTDLIFRIISHAKPSGSVFETAC
jgi:DNA-binding response OmpR family regulator